MTGAVVASVVAVLAAGAPFKLGLVFAVLAGIGAAMATELLLDRRQGGE